MSAAAARVGSDEQSDVCRCPACTSPFIAPRHHLPRGVESPDLDPIDVLAMRTIEGRLAPEADDNV